MPRAIYLLSVSMKEDTIVLPMIRFETIAKDLNLGACDLLMFTSKQAVKSAEALNPAWKMIPSLAVGAATAKEIEALGGSVLYQPTSFDGQTLSQEIVEKFHDKKILYLRPQTVSFDAKTFLHQSGIEIEEQILYKTSCMTYEPSAAPKRNAIIIFTSPSTIDCFFKNFTWNESYTAVVIGKTTQAHLPKNVRCEVSEVATIDACIQKAKEVLLTSNSK